MRVFDKREEVGMVKTAAALVVIGILSTTAASVSAHHSFAAEFDSTKPITLRGTVTKIERTNPHGWIYLDVKEPNGAVNNWAIETNAPAALARRGVTKESLSIGTEVKIEGFRAKDGTRMVNGTTLTLPDGRDFPVGSPTTDSPSK
jgi:hypothetical protein